MNMDAETYPRTLRRRTANHNKRMQCTVRDAASSCQKLDAFACLHRTLGGHDKECLANLASSALKPVHSKPSTCASNPYRTLRLHREVLPGSPPLQGLHVEEVVRGIGLLSLPKKSLEIGRVLSPKISTKAKDVQTCFGLPVELHGLKRGGRILWLLLGNSLRITASSFRARRTPQTS